LRRFCRTPAFLSSEKPGFIRSSARNSTFARLGEGPDYSFLRNEYKTNPPAATGILYNEEALEEKRDSRRKYSFLFFLFFPQDPANSEALIPAFRFCAAGGSQTEARLSRHQPYRAREGSMLLPAAICGAPRPDVFSGHRTRKGIPVGRLLRRLRSTSYPQGIPEGLESANDPPALRRHPPLLFLLILCDYVPLSLPRFNRHG